MEDSLLFEARTKRRRKRVYFVLCVSIIILYAIFCGAVWVIVKSPIFRIQEISIEGNSEVSSDDIIILLHSRVVRGDSPKALLGFDNILIWPDKIEARDLFFLPPVKGLNIKKDYSSRKVVVIIEERQPVGVWCGQSRTGSETAADYSDGQNADKGDAIVEQARCWWFDKEGVIFKKAPLVRGSLILAISDYSRQGLGLNLKILPDVFIGNMFSVFDVIRASGLGIKEIKLDNLALQEIEVRTYEGPKLYFSLRFPSAWALDVINNFQFQPGFNKLQYLDFRVEKKVYFK